MNFLAEYKKLCEKHGKHISTCIICELITVVDTETQQELETHLEECKCLEKLKIQIKERSIEQKVNYLIGEFALLRIRLDKVERIQKLRKCDPDDY